MTSNTDSRQVAVVLAYLEANPKGLTSRECSRKLNIDRLAARIFEIAKSRGITRTRVTLKSGKKVMRYSLTPQLA